MRQLSQVLTAIFFFFFIQTLTAGKLVDLGEYGSGPYTKVEKYNSTLYVVSSGTGVKLFNLSDTNELTELEGLDSTCQPVDIQVSQSTLIVSCAFNVLFYSLSEPSAPELIANFYSPSYTVNSVLLENDRLYMLGGNRDFQIYDATDLSSLVLISEINVNEVTGPTLKKSGDIVYFQQQNNKVVLIDVANEAAPQVASEVLADGNYILYTAQIEGNTLYMGRGVGLQIVDISNPYSPSLIEYRKVDADIGSLDSFYSIDIDGNMLYALSINGIVYSADLTDPHNPNFLFNGELLGFFPFELKYMDGLIYVASGINGLVVIKPETSTNLVTIENTTDALMVNNININSGRAVIADEFRVFHYLDISNQGNVTRSGKVETSFARTGLADGNFSWLGVFGMLQTYDVTNFSNPIQYDSQIVQSYSDYINHISKIENQMFVGTDNGVVKVYDMSGIIPAEYTSVNLGLDADTGKQHRVNDIVPYDDYLLVSTSVKDLIIIDISSPASPVIKSQIKLTDFEPYKNRLFTSGEFVLLFAETDIFVWDLSNIDSPTLSAQGNEFGYIHGATGLNESMVVISTSNGLSLLDITNPLNISVSDFISDGAVSTSLDSDGSLVVVKSLDSASLKIFQYNRSPQASNANFSVDEDNSVVDYVAAVDPEGDDISFSMVGEPANGSVSITSDGQFTYEPDADYSGQDSFTFKAEDSYGSSSEGTITIAVSPVNDAPVASNGSLITAEDSPVSGSFNALDVDGDELTFSIEAQPVNGSVSITADGQFTYVPHADFNGMDSMTFTAKDGYGGSSVGTVSIAINPVNDAPVASNVSLITAEDSPVSDSLTASDVDGDDITFSIVGEPANGSVSITPEGQFTYQPDVDFNGQDSFIFQVEDSNGGNSEGTVAITVNAVNDAPTAANVSLTTTVDSSVTGSFNASDVDGDELTYDNTNPSNGSLSVSGSSFTYTPDAGFSGQDSFQYTATDSGGKSITATVTVTVNKPASSGSGGGSSDVWLLALLLLGFTFRRQVS